MNYENFYNTRKVELKDIISSGLLELYCLGLATPAEVSEVEQWAAQYPEVAAEIEAIRLGMEGYAGSHAVTPSPSVKDKLFAQLGIDDDDMTSAPVAATGNNIAEESEAKVYRMPRYWKVAAAAAVILIAGSAILNMVFYSKYTTLSKDLAATQAALAVEKQHNDDMKNDMAVVQNPNSMSVSLKEMQPASGRNAKIYWMQNTHEVMVDASNLPDAPAGKQYQFWGIVDGKPVDGGLIITTDKGKKFRMQKMKSFGRAEAFAISLEKEGGNPTPTEVVSMGKISL